MYMTERHTLDRTVRRYIGLRKQAVIMARLLLVFASCVCNIISDIVYSTAASRNN